MVLKREKSIIINERQLLFVRPDDSKFSLSVADID
jgi:hypothetical protein